MAKITLPFSMENKADDHNSGLARCDLFNALPSPLKEVAGENTHLLDYLHLVPIGEVGMPRYCTELSRKMADEKKPNIIYPVGHKNVFAHILFDQHDTRHNYIIVEPTLIMDLDTLVREVERKCIEYADKFIHFDFDGDREKQLVEYVEHVTTLADRPHPVTSNKDDGNKRKDGNKSTTIQVTQQELEGIKYLFMRDKIGLGVLEPLIGDPYIEDIGCSGLGHIFIEHKIFKSLKSTITFFSFEELDEFVLRLAERLQKPVTYKNPVADATLPDGSRINIVFGRDVSKRGSNFTIRKFKEVPISIFELVDFGTVDYQMLAYLSLVIGNGMNLFFAGESASGKTALLNALTTFMHPLNKIISIEDTPELQVPHKNWIREVVQTTKPGDRTGSVTMFDLLKAALRQRPNEILVGEIRGPEGNIAFQAMQTGHSVKATFHAASVQKLIQRMTNNPISVPKTYIDNLNIIIIMGMVKLPSGDLGRRVTNIAEIVGYDPLEDYFNIIETFHWDETKDRFDFTGHMSSYILEYKIAPMIGIPSRQKQKIYSEVERRAKILAKLHKERGITDFYEVLDVLGKAQREGLF